jgi:hypothetical protein
LREEAEASINPTQTNQEWWEIQGPVWSLCRANLWFRKQTSIKLFSSFFCFSIMFHCKKLARLKETIERSNTGDGWHASRPVPCGGYIEKQFMQ